MPPGHLHNPEVSAMTTASEYNGLVEPGAGFPIRAFCNGRGERGPHRFQLRGNVESPPVTVDRRFYRLFYRCHLSFPAKQVLGFSLPAQRLCKTAGPIRPRHLEQLVYHDRGRSGLPFHIHFERSYRQALRHSVRDHVQLYIDADDGLSSAPARAKC
jgi:hypothetical protein